MVKVDVVFSVSDPLCAPPPTWTKPRCSYGVDMVDVTDVWADASAGVSSSPRISSARLLIGRQSNSRSEPARIVLMGDGLKSDVGRRPEHATDVRRESDT